MKWISILIFYSVITCCTQRASNIKVAAVEVVMPVIRIESSDEMLRFDKGFWYYGAEHFSGIITERFSNGNIKTTTHYNNGKENGWQTAYYLNGRLREKRFYKAGEKDGIHNGWWENGHERFEYRFEKGVYNGDYKEWFESGAMYKHIHYTNGVDDWGLGWRENGKLYMNYVMKNGRRYGIINAGLCYSLKDEQGDYVKGGK